MARPSLVRKRGRTEPDGTVFFFFFCPVCFPLFFPPLFLRWQPCSCLSKPKHCPPGSSARQSFDSSAPRPLIGQAVCIWQGGTPVTSRPIPLPSPPRASSPTIVHVNPIKQNRRLGILSARSILHRPFLFCLGWVCILQKLRPSFMSCMSACPPLSAPPLFFLPQTNSYVCQAVISPPLANPKSDETTNPMLPSPTTSRGLEACLFAILCNPW